MATNTKGPVNYDSGWLTSEGVPVLSAEEASACLEVELTFNRFCQALDADDSQAFAGLFTAEAIAEFDSSPKVGTLRGAKSLADWHATRRREQKKAGCFYRHQAMVPVINVSGEQAELLAYLTADELQFDDGRPHVEMGRYEAKLQRTADGWRIAGLRELLFFSFRANEPQYHQDGRKALTALGHTVPGENK